MKKLFPIYVNKFSPCYTKDHLGNGGCPAKNDIPRFLYLVSQRRFEEAFYVLKETNPFSGGCGRFCDHPCETACNRAKFDYPVDIKSLERFVADWGYNRNLEPKNLKTKNGKHIAIIGSGPAGLSCGYFLARDGFKVDIFERHSQPGGLLTEGIPSYRYPRDIFQKELDYIKKTGVDIHTDTNVDRDKFLSLVEEYDAIVVATGAQKGSKMNIEGEDDEAVYNGIDFLRAINTGDIESLKIKDCETVGIIGGGYTAFDVARCSIRIGLKSTIIYRRTINEMTAHPGEVKECEEEGIDFRFLRQPVKIERVGDKLKLVCQVMKLGPVDESGRSKPVPIKNRFEEFLFDRIVVAIGDKPDLSYVGERFCNEFPKLNCLDLPEKHKDKVFIAGDAAMGGSDLIGMVVRAVGSAQITSRAVKEFLTGETTRNIERDIAYFNTLNTKYFQKRYRYEEERLSAEKRKDNFNEIVPTMDEEMAVYMSTRCFYCGICIQCDWCYFYSDGTIAKKLVNWDKTVDAVFYKFDKVGISSATFKSVEACPRSALSIVTDDIRYKDKISEQYQDIKKELL